MVLQIVSSILTSAGTPLQLTPLASFYAGLTTFFAEILAFIPNLIAALIILLIGYLIVRAVVKVLGITMQRTNLDRHVGNTNLGKAIEKSGHPMSNIVLTTVKWLLYLIVIVYAISALGIPPLTASMLGVLGWIPDLIAVVIIVFVGALVASWVGKGIENTLPKYGVGGGRIIGLAVELLIYLIVFNFAMIQIGFAQGIIFTITTALSWGFAAALAIGFGVAIALALREILPPMVSGSTTIASTLKEGQQISIEGIPNLGNGGGGRVSGTVRSVGMFNTVLQQGKNGGAKGFLVLPNNLLMDKPITIESGEEPIPFEHNVRGRVSDLHERFEQQAGEGKQNNPNTLESRSTGGKYSVYDSEKDTGR